MTPIEIRHFHFFCGLGGGAKGFNQGHARVGSMEARFRCLGGVDSEPAAIRDFERLAGVRGTCMDLFSREQYRHYHGQEPPTVWREAMPADIRCAAGDEHPHIVFLSAPCKGFSGLLSQKRSTTEKYQALNALTLRGIWLMCEAWQDDPVDLIAGTEDKAEASCCGNISRASTRERALAKTKLEESVMWAVKAITG